MAGECEVGSITETKLFSIILIRIQKRIITFFPLPKATAKRWIYFLLQPFPHHHSNRQVFRINYSLRKKIKISSNRGVCGLEKSLHISIILSHIIDLCRDWIHHLGLPIDSSFCTDRQQLITWMSLMKTASFCQMDLQGWSVSTWIRLLRMHAK